MLMANYDTSDILEETENKEVGINEKPEIKLYPNPNPGIFQIETNFPLSNIGNFKVTNLLGVTVYETKNVSSNTIQLKSSSSGVHFVVIFLKDGSILTQKMMVQ
jgi:hypothetical protein